MAGFELLMARDSREPFPEVPCEICGRPDCEINHTEELEEMAFDEGGCY